MDSRQIEKIMKNFAGPYYWGTFPRNKMPTCVVPPFSLVCNTEPDTELGEHWIAIYVDGAENGEYFDSYGLPPLHAEFTQFLDYNCRKWIWNSKQIQDISSMVCGQHCIFYLHQRYKGFSLEEIKDFFTKDAQQNDEIVKRYVRNL